ncbi:hypothetical protein [Cohnella hashimotonis]|uniref:Uncharacterized protein n=1 Tax=Cohnella hashimotonis TaxID=2826895 RepID=A0ABT6TMY2_9BACL|nr:hypothetical protein [Cohnella hashimotonis]MDI4648074.1 hypothetical protein [Cohnella hashimotonis]
MKFFDGYVKNYHTFNFSIHHGKHSFTMTEIEYFSRLGSVNLDKLFCDREVRPYNVIGIMSIPSIYRVEELLSIAKATCKVDNALLVFKTYSSRKSQSYFDEAHAYLLNKRKIIATKLALVSDIGGTLFMHFNKPSQGEQWTT